MTFTQSRTSTLVDYYISSMNIVRVIDDIWLWYLYFSLKLSRTLSPCLHIVIISIVERLKFEDPS